MVTKKSLKELVIQAVKASGFEIDDKAQDAISIDYPDTRFGDFSVNAAMVLAKSLKMNPREAAEKIIANISPDYFSKIEIAGPGFINFFIKDDFLLAETQVVAQQGIVKPRNDSKEKILLEYFQPNIAKPMHIGLLRTAVIGDALKRMFKYLGYQVESDTHMGDWGTQFGFIILAYKKYGNDSVIDKDPINELNKLYVQINAEAESDEAIRDAAKREFIKLEQSDDENKKIWKKFVDWSMNEFLQINSLMDIEQFDHHLPESFYEDRMPLIVEELKAQGLVKESQGAQIVDLEDQKLGVAVIVKSDGGTIYALRDLATFLYRKSLGFTKQLYVVDNRQSHAFRQLFAILKLVGAMQGEEAIHIDYGFISFKGEALSTRKGNMVLVKDVLAEAKTRVAKIIQEKNPDLKNKGQVIDAVAKGALKYFDLSHNRHSDIEFDWDEALSFEGNSGPYLQYVYARLSSILRKEDLLTNLTIVQKVSTTETERQIMVELTKFNDVVSESLKDYLPNVLANYLYELASLTNKFYHESPVIKEDDQVKKQFRLTLVLGIKNVLGQGLELLGITPLDEM